MATREGCGRPVRGKHWVDCHRIVGHRPCCCPGSCRRPVLAAGAARACRLDDHSCPEAAAQPNPAVAAVPGARCVGPRLRGRRLRKPQGSRSTRPFIPCPGSSSTSAGTGRPRLTSMWHAYTVSSPTARAATISGRGACQHRNRQQCQELHRRAERVTDGDAAGCVPCGPCRQAADRRHRRPWA